MKQVFSLLVENTSGVLSRVAGLFSRRGYNICSITAGETTDPRYTRITVTAEGDDERVLDQIRKQLSKLIDVVDIKILKPESSVDRELILVKIRAAEDQRQGILSTVSIFRGKIVDVSSDSMIIELTGSGSKLDAFLKLLANYEILELARSGVTGLSRGSEDVRYL